MVICIYFNGSGACQGLDNAFTGWHQQDGDWYYIQKGSCVTTGTIAVDGRIVWGLIQTEFGLLIEN